MVLTTFDDGDNQYQPGIDSYDDNALHRSRIVTPLLTASIEVHRIATHGASTHISVESAPCRAKKSVDASLAVASVGR